MGTPLARQLKSIRTLLRNVENFEFHQLARILLRNQPDASLRVGVGDYASHTGLTTTAVQATNTQDAAITLNPAAFLDEDEAHAAADSAVARHVLWELARPYIQLERNVSAGHRFLDECDMFHAIEGVNMPRDYLAYAAGAIRRGVDVGEVCSDYFGIPVEFEPLDASSAHLRVGPLDWDRYCELLPGGSPVAGRRLLELASAIAGAGISFEVTLLLRDNEAPGCVPGTAGAVVGATAWPGCKARRGGDVKKMFNAAEWSLSHV